MTTKRLNMTTEKVHKCKMTVKEIKPHTTRGCLYPVLEGWEASDMSVSRGPIV